MNRPRLVYCAFWVLFILCCSPPHALAYVGPGTGLSAVGVFLAVVMGFIIVVFGFVWYPVKRLWRACRKSQMPNSEEENSDETETRTT